MKTTIERINPDQARLYLESNLEKQRNVTKNHVRHLAQQMKQGQWMENGEPIIFNIDGELIDGQHRLLAVIESGYECDFLVVRGVSKDAFLTINTGKSRGAANIFSIHGVKSSNYIAAAVKSTLNYRRAMNVNTKKDGSGNIISGGSLNSYIKSSTADMIREYDLHPEEYSHAVSVGVKARNIIPSSISGMLVAVALIDRGHNTNIVDYFFDSLTIGAGLEIDDPILTLRNKMISNNQSNHKLSGYLVAILLIKAWNFYIQNKKCHRLMVMENEGCPAIL